MPLTLANVGEPNIIRKVGGGPETKKHLEDMGFVAGGTVTVVSMIGGNPEVKKHLEDLGFVAGDTVTIVSSLNGNVIVKVKESRVAISEEMARKIMV